jgi:hypothetical protein
MRPGRMRSSDRWWKPRSRSSVATACEGTVSELIEHDSSGGALGGHCYPGVSWTIGCGEDTPIHYGQAALDFSINHPKDD